MTAINGTEYDGDTMVGYSVKLGKIFDVNKFLQDGDIGNKVLVWCYLKYLSDENRVIWAIRFIEKRFYPLAQKVSSILTNTIILQVFNYIIIFTLFSVRIFFTREWLHGDPQRHLKSCFIIYEIIYHFLWSFLSVLSWNFSFVPISFWRFL